MAKDLLSEQKMPTPIGAFSTGNAKADAALAKLAVWEHSAHHPATRPGGTDYEKACSAATGAGWKALVKVLETPGLFEIGQSVWDQDRYDRLAPAKKKECKKQMDACDHARKERVAFIAFLFEAVIPEGYARLLEIASDDDVDADVRLQAVRYLRANFSDDKKKLLAVSKAFDFVNWKGGDQRLEMLAEECIECWHDANPKAAFDALSKLVTPEAVNKNPDRADAIVSSLRQEDVDPRWVAVCGRLVKNEAVDVVACMAIEAQPVDPAVIPAILEALGPLDKVQFLWDGLVKIVARVGAPETVPILQRAIALSPNDAEQFIAMIPKKAKAVIAAVQATPVKKSDGKRSRPTLVYKKVKAFKTPRLPPLAKQQAEVKKLFADAGIAAAYDKLAQRSVVLIPTRVDESKLAVGVSKLGGHPDLPDGVEWPRVAKQPLTFLAQLRLSDFTKLLPKGELPKDGTLAIFVDNDAQNDKGEYLTNARAIYTKQGAKLARREVPDDYVDVIYQACKVELREKLSLPSPSNAHATKLLDKASLEKYEADVYVHGTVLPQVLGYREHGYDAEEPATARLLLQLPGDDQSDMEFGDADALSFFIATKDLAKGKFAKVWPHIGD